jgi:hypothetical protein
VSAFRPPLASAPTPGSAVCAVVADLRPARRARPTGGVLGREVWPPGFRVPSSISSSSKRSICAGRDSERSECRKPSSYTPVAYHSRLLPPRSTAAPRQYADTATRGPDHACSLGERDTVRPRGRSSRNMRAIERPLTRARKRSLRVQQQLPNSAICTPSVHTWIPGTACRTSSVSRSSDNRCPLRPGR